MTNSKEYQDENFYKTLATTFTAVFIAELGDKTQVATLLLSAESGNPLIVFIGGSLALILSSLFGVLLGRLGHLLQLLLAWIQISRHLVTQRLQRGYLRHVCLKVLLECAECRDTTLFVEGADSGKCDSVVR